MSPRGEHAAKGPRDERGRLLPRDPEARRAVAVAARTPSFVATDGVHAVEPGVAEQPGVAVEGDVAEQRGVVEQPEATEQIVDPISAFLEEVEAPPALPPSLGRWIAGAKQHGLDSDPEHEAGDLIDLIYSLHSAMEPDQVAEAMRTHAAFHGRPWGDDEGEEDES